ncbi:hypothetical protein CEXT_537731 [Caerostris extrusa]|uniref:Uncharacterized protein n=1 Tax=Caerostris extrusa TaxID=172846 RepID=A0AAV4UBB1_CAEEX|nr:hypothetical protein CEXT_537731 [Caerostris extrusa]
MTQGQNGQLEGWAFVAFVEFRNYDLRVSIRSSGNKAGKAKGLRGFESQGLRIQRVNRAWWLAKSRFIIGSRQR